MGFWGIKLFDREQDKLRKSFSSLNKSLNEQKQWIDYLHEKTIRLHKDTFTLKDHHIRHKSELNEYFCNINSWIDYLHNNHKQLDNKITILEKNLNSMIKKEMRNYHDELIKIIAETLASQPDKEDLIADVLQEIEMKERITPATAIPIEQNRYEQRDITQPEQELLNFLFNENTPLTYEDISNKTQKSINTIRVYMNSLKKKSMIEEFKKPNGVKIFSIKNREKVKTLFNI